jgi:hypothetical protein
MTFQKLAPLLPQHVAVNLFGRPFRARILLAFYTGLKAWAILCRAVPRLFRDPHSAFPCHLPFLILSYPMSGWDNDKGAIREAIRRIDQENSADPHSFVVDGKPVPYELFYSQRLTDWVLRLRSNASPALLLAARCQHICRWTIPRDTYPKTRTGYLKWRTDLKRFHAQKSGQILAESGCAPALIARVQELNLKKDLGHDEELQVLEDALCLMTLQYQLTDLMEKTDSEKIPGILEKTWKKMSAQARAEALRLPYTDAQRNLLTQVLRMTDDK